MSSPRLFVALWPSADACSDLSLLHRKDEPGVRFVPEENWHVTLRFLGEAHPREVAEALDDVDFRAADITLGPIVEYLGDHSLIVHASGAEALNEVVERATSHLGDAPLRKRFVGHITIARLGRRRSVRQPAVVGTPFHSTFTVAEVALVQSHLAPEGARYETLAAWPTR
ncbi:MAG TPA: RNA 2',3'-cyclic phosphodiesterase [Ilumatobacter sp.]|nr:RNA 2',3'-cyclic phosphodiesterase [Ilumatobacter sp.]